MNKKDLRAHLKKTRSSLHPSRREEASQPLLFQLLPTLDHATSVLSFVPFSDEIDISLINLYLARTGRLLLPKISGNTLEVFHVSNPHGHLVPNGCGLLEPHPKLCTQRQPHEVEIILVPGLGFDSHNHRIGYGGGYYDRFLKLIPQAQTIGIGFKEQFISSIPFDDNDIPLEKVFLF